MMSYYELQYYVFANHKNNTEYYEKALKSPVGQRVEQFYIGAKRQVSDVHGE